MKRLIAILVTLSLLVCLLPSALAFETDPSKAADVLHTLGLFQGMGTDANGNPDYGLDREATRAEAVTMLVRLLGREKVANEETWDLPFTDLAQWSIPYVGYAWANGLVKGVSDTLFDGSSSVTAAQFVTLLLRAMHYSDAEGDFVWSSPWELSDRLGFTQGEYASDTPFTRGDMVLLCRNALNCPQKDGKKLGIRLYQQIYFGPNIMEATGLAEEFGMITLPAPVIRIEKDKKTGQEILNWNEIMFPDEDKHGIDGYGVYASLSEDGPYSCVDYCSYPPAEISEIVENGSTYLGFTFEEGKTYYLRLRAHQDFKEINIEECFSPLSNAVSFVYHEKQNAPKDVLSSVFTDLYIVSEAAVSAMKAVNLSINATYSSVRLIYAQQSQQYFISTAKYLARAIETCQQYDDLATVESYLQTLYSGISHLAEFPLTQSNVWTYLDDAAHSGDFADALEAAVNEVYRLNDLYGY